MTFLAGNLNTLHHLGGKTVYFDHKNDAMARPKFCNYLVDPGNNESAAGYSESINAQSQKSTSL